MEGFSNYSYHQYYCPMGQPWLGIAPPTCLCKKNVVKTHTNKVVDHTSYDSKNEILIEIKNLQKLIKQLIDIKSIDGAS